MQSQVYGKSAESENGKALMRQYAANIMAADPVDMHPVDRPQATPVAVNGVLSNEQAVPIRDRVLRRCQLSGDIEENKLPWYFHYLLGLEYDAAGDNGRALDSFQLGANIRENPGRNKRLYGMWFMDYLPYFQIARTQAQLGAWQQARDALNLSRQSGEFSPADPDFESFSTLETQVNANLGRGDS